MLMGHVNKDADVSEELDSWDLQTQQIHWPLGGVLTSEYAPALRALGLFDPVETRLGRGGFGVVYKVKHRGRVSALKLTRDPMEVIASWALRGRPSQHVVHIHEVWSLPKMQRFGHWASWWVIHRDYLHDFSRKDGDLLETLFDLWKDEDIDLSIPKPGDSGRSMREKWRQVIKHETTCSSIEMNRSLSLLDQISRGIRELGAVGIDWSDLLPDNLLCDSSGILRVADVGFGRAKRHIECEPPELTVELARAYVEAAG